MRWQTIPLGGVASLERRSLLPEEIESGTNYLGLEHIESGGRILTYQKVEPGELRSNKFIFDSGTLLYGKLRPYLAKVCIPDREGCCSTDILPIRPSEKLDIGYLKHLLLWKPYVDKATSLCAGANLPRISPSSLLGIEIPLPPLEEQRRIAAILDKAALLNQRGDEAFAKIEQLERSTFEAYFGAHALEECWENGPLANFCALITDGEHQTPERTPSGIKLLSARNIRDGRLDLRKVDYVPLHEYERISRRCGPRRGDVFISCSGSIGRVTTYDSDEPVALVRSVALVRPLKDKLRPLFLEFLLRSPRLQALMDRAANASSQANLFQGPIKALQIFAPPLDRQDAFIAEIASLRRVEACCQDRMTRLEKLSASIMNKTFA
jgi:type I restriction enzyme S subunit